jgi:hypothetical protein
VKRGAAEKEVMLTREDVKKVTEGKDLFLVLAELKTAVERRPGGQ